MRPFEIRIDAARDADWDEAQPVALYAGGVCLTRLVRHGAGGQDDHLEAPPIQLAFWFIDNWWRLRWEPRPVGEIPAEWRLAHEISSIGGGCAWPAVRIWNDGNRIGLSSCAEPPDMNLSVRYLTNALVYMPAARFEEEVDRFLARALEARSSDHEALRVSFEALKTEREDADYAAWRRREAELGFDPDEAPESLIEAAI